MLVHYAIGSVVEAKLTVLADCRRRFAALAQEEETLKKELLAAAPEKLRLFLIDNGVLDGLFAYGRVSLKIRFGREGFGNFQDIRNKFKDLQKTWKNNVAVRFAEPEQERVEVFLTATNPFA